MNLYLKLVIGIMLVCCTTPVLKSSGVRRLNNLGSWLWTRSFKSPPAFTTKSRSMRLKDCDVIEDSVYYLLICQAWLQKNFFTRCENAKMLSSLSIGSAKRRKFCLILQHILNRTRMSLHLLCHFNSFNCSLF